MLCCSSFLRKKGNCRPFIDSVKVLLSSGAGGDGASVMSHEHSNEFAGPGGGNGGNGGNVMLRCVRRYGDLQHIQALGDQVSASAGCAGYARKAHGKRGRDLWLEVPMGTVVSDVDTNEVMFDLDKDGTEVMLLEGGQGGKGNACFANKWYHSPVESTRGLPSNSMLAQIELKSLADCGLIGYPNAGKSSVLASISTSKPAIAPYAFTTLRPYVGVIHDLYGNTCRVADIPGLIEGAYENRGLGHHFLRHVERTKALAFVVDMHDTYCPLTDSAEAIPPWDVVRLLQCELEYFAPGLSKNAIMVIANKMDLQVDKNGVPLMSKVAELRKRTRLPVFPVSAALGLVLGPGHKDTGLEPVLQMMCAHVARATKMQEQAYRSQRACERAELDTMFESMNNGIYAHGSACARKDDTEEVASLVDQQLGVLGHSGMGDDCDAFANSIARGKLHKYRDYSMKGRYWTLTRQHGEKFTGELWQ